MPIVPINVVSSTLAAGVATAQVTPASKLPDQWEITRAGGSLAPPSGLVPEPSPYKPLRPTIRWPGAVSCVNLSYVNSRGISPGIAVLTLNPQAAPPDTFGDLLFSDGLRPWIKLRDCHLDHLEVAQTTNSSFVICQIADRRWRWQQGYPISGHYNELDPHGNFIPWTVQSAKELAILCLKKMGEKRYTIAFPPGLKSTQADKYDRALRAGERFPLTYANPTVLWDNIPAAVALQQLASQFGCDVMYDPISDSVAVLPIGYGSLLPYGGTSVASASQGITASRLPEYLEVVGANIKFQMRVKLEAVGDEYDGFYTPIKKLSYAPILVAAGTDAASIRGWDRSMPPDFPNVEPTDRLAYSEAQEHAQRSVFRAYRIAENAVRQENGYRRDSAGDLQYVEWETDTRYVQGIDVSGKVGIRVPGLRDDIVTGGFDGDLWDSLFAAKTRELPGSDINDRFKAIRASMFEILTRRQQIILTMEKVDQVVPRPRRDDDIVRDPNQPLVPGSLPDYYNGYSRDRPAECFGTYHRTCSQVWYKLSSDIVEKRRIYLPFNVNAFEQLVIFGAPLYTLTGSGSNRLYKPAADLFIETGVYIRDPNTNYPYRCRYRINLGGPAPGISEMHEDIITHIVGEYDDATNDIKGYHVNDFGDGKARAKYYLAGMKRRFQNWQQQTVTYNGCMLIAPSGSIQQIQWQVGLSGIRTTAGVNTEFSPNIPPYPVRKLIENMPPNEQAKRQNQASSPLHAANQIKNLVAGALGLGGRGQ